jgi:hypothetical protein
MAKDKKPPGLGFDSPGGYWDVANDGPRSRRAASPAKARTPSATAPAATPKKAAKKAPMKLPKLPSKAAVVHAGAVFGSLCLGLGLVFLGALCAVKPELAATMYGLKATETSYVIAAGLRDFALGLATLAIFKFNKSALLFLACAILTVPLGDSALTYTLSGSLTAVAPHAVGTVCIAALCAFLKLDPAF